MNQETAAVNWAELVFPHLKTLHLCYYCRLELDPQNIQAIRGIFRKRSPLFTLQLNSLSFRNPTQHQSQQNATFQTQQLDCCYCLLAWPRCRKSLFWLPRGTSGCPSLNISQLSRFTSMLIQVLGNNTTAAWFVPFVFFIYVSCAGFFLVLFFRGPGAKTY